MPSLIVRPLSGTVSHHRADEVRGFRRGISPVYLYLQTDSRSLTVMGKTFALVVAATLTFAMGVGQATAATKPKPPPGLRGWSYVGNVSPYKGCWKHRKNAHVVAYSCAPLRGSEVRRTWLLDTRTGYRFGANS